MKNKTIFIVLLLVASSLFLSCRSRMTTSQRKAYKMEKRMKKENKKQVEAFYEHHYAIQTDRTRKMMKSSKKRAKSINSYRKRSWFSRLFKSKGSKDCDGN